ncbi:sigma-E factor regulatory protein RseB domain-containing protein [Pseudogracilibacillus auburnensis]|uniref:Outer membrane lipoprotein-sorting protein n=1 Tax=Pseudogracilibacillus auburnensis TaxID=1494959 RepID=A0A2V3W4H3_9BACI|nr:sigma-E factor regulatory protein RseB domain-containing protein [Pseudogracilibacillus auburnensis]PXW87961.1 outer membrane lipoprotein-sorting protein [Pseudogracilibacillus auburnensis]
MIGNHKLKLLLIGFLIISLFGCKQMNQYTPEKVISNALGAEKEVSYYGELKFDLEEIEEFKDVVVKEWRHQNKSRIEVDTDEGAVVVVVDEEYATIYQEEDKTAFKVAFGNMFLDQMYMSPKELVESLLNQITDTHEIENVGKEKVANRDAFHLVAKKKKDKKSLYGDQELWIDKENWVVLKTKMTNGDIENTVEYTKIDFNPKIDESLFQLDLPEDVDIETVDDFEEYSEEITMEEIPEKMEKNIFLFPDNDEHKLDTISFTEIEGDFGYTDLTIDYKRSDGSPLMTLTIFKTSDNEANDEITDDEFDIYGEDAEKIKIRDTQALYINFNELHSVNWIEGGVNYSIDLIDPDLTLEDVQKLAEEMKEIK